MTYINACISSKFGQIRPLTTELPTLSVLKNLYSYKADNDVIICSGLFIIVSFSYLQIIMTCIYREFELGQITAVTSKLAALTGLKLIYMYPPFSVDIDPICFILAGNGKMHERV